MFAKIKETQKLPYHQVRSLICSEGFVRVSKEDNQELTGSYSNGKNYLTVAKSFKVGYYLVNKGIAI